MDVHETPVTGAKTPRCRELVRKPSDFDADLSEMAAQILVAESVREFR
jgi:hypothetical protein